MERQARSYLLAYISAKAKLIKARRIIKVQLFTNNVVFAVQLKRFFGGSYCKNGTGYNWNLASRKDILALKEEIKKLYPYITLFDKYD